jgi:hypothetical protein
VTALQVLDSAAVLEVHVVPLALVATAPEEPTAQNRLKSGLQQTEIKAKAPADLAVHVTPSGLVITRFVPPLETATNKVSSGLHAIPFHAFASAADLDVQFIPSGLVITRFVPSVATAANKDNSGLHATLVHVLASVALSACHRRVDILARVAFAAAASDHNASVPSFVRNLPALPLAEGYAFAVKLACTNAVVAILVELLPRL